jgi:hypothetical protein
VRRVATSFSFDSPEALPEEWEFCFHTGLIRSQRPGALVTPEMNTELYRSLELRSKLSRQRVRLTTDDRQARYRDSSHRRPTDIFTGIRHCPESKHRQGASDLKRSPYNPLPGYKGVL